MRRSSSVGIKKFTEMRGKMSKNKCHYCKSEKEQHDLRPYGPNGVMVCCPCVREDPDRNDLAIEMMSKLLLEVAQTSSVVVLDDNGFRKFEAEDLMNFPSDKTRIH